MVNKIDSIRSLAEKVNNLIGSGSIDSALRTIHNCVERIVTEPLCVAQAFSSPQLDHLCHEIGRLNLLKLRALNSPSNIDFQSIDKPIVVYIVSRLQRSGGHSRLVQDYIHSQPQKYHIILSTEVGGPSDKVYFNTLFSSISNVSFIIAPRGNFQFKLSWLQSSILALIPECVYLLNHHQDSAAVAAITADIGVSGKFIHHGDHHLTLGVHLDHLEHIDLHPEGYHYCRNNLNIDNYYLPLTFQDKNKYHSATVQSLGNVDIVTATAARSNKIEHPYYVNYLDTIPLIIKATGGRHIHIGKLTPWAVRRIFRQLQLHGIDKAKFEYVPWTPSVWMFLRENNVDVYIASFPYGAGLTLIEAMGAGVPVIMHRHMYSRVLGGVELAYPEAFSWSEIEDLLCHLSLLSPDALKNEGEIARKRFEDFHDADLLKQYFRDPSNFQFEVPVLSNRYTPRYDEWAFWVQSQMTLAQLIRRALYRTWRRLRLFF